MKGPAGVCQAGPRTRIAPGIPPATLAYPLAKGVQSRAPRQPGSGSIEQHAALNDHMTNRGKNFKSGPPRIRARGGDDPTSIRAVLPGPGVAAFSNSPSPGLRRRRRAAAQELTLHYPSATMLVAGSSRPLARERGRQTRGAWCALQGSPRRGAPDGPDAMGRRPPDAHGRAEEAHAVKERQR